MGIDNTLDWYESLEEDLGYRIEANKTSFAVLLNALLMEQDISRAELAKRIQKSAPYVTKLLRGDANPTITTMTKVFDAIDCDLHINGCRKGHEARWVTIVAGGEVKTMESNKAEFSSIWAKQASNEKAA